MGHLLARMKQCSSRVASEVLEEDRAQCHYFEEVYVLYVVMIKPEVSGLIAKTPRIKN